MDQLLMGFLIAFISGCGGLLLVVLVARPGSGGHDGPPPASH